MPWNQAIYSVQYAAAAADQSNEGSPVPGAGRQCNASSDYPAMSGSGSRVSTLTAGLKVHAAQLK